MSTLLQEFESFCQSQIARLANQDLEVRPSIKTLIVPAGYAAHAVGKRKPNLTQLESQRKS